MIYQFNLRYIVLFQFLIIFSSCKPVENCDYHLITHGTVTDSGGSPIANVAITFSNSISGPSLAVTDSSGYYNTGSRLYYVSIKDTQIAMAKSGFQNTITAPLTSAETEQCNTTVVITRNAVMNP